MSGAEFDDDLTAAADNRRGPDGRGGTEEATQVAEGEVLRSLGAQDYGEGVPTVEGYGALREIGRGGFSRVYEALQFEFRRWVAIKVLMAPLDSEEAVAQFERECRLMGVLSRHPNIVTVFASAFTSEDLPCIVMELFPHGSYMNILRRVGPLGLEELLPLTVRISGALATAHRQGMVHGDVKPQNIFQSDFGSAALGDFGIATLMHQRTSATKTRLSLYYAAPELIESGVAAASPFSDQYSLASTIYTLATGQRPFETETGDTTGQLFSRMLSEPAPRLGAEFPASLDDALWQAMAREPQDRHRDLVALAAAISRVERELGFRPTEMPITREQGRYVGQTPVMDRPAPTTSSRSQDSPAPSPIGDEPLGTASREQLVEADSRTVVRPLTPTDTESALTQPEQPQEKRRVPLWAKIGLAVAAVAAASIGVLVVLAGGDDEQSLEPPAAAEPPEDDASSADAEAGGGSGDVDDPGADDGGQLPEERSAPGDDDGEDTSQSQATTTVSSTTTTEPARTVDAPTVPAAPLDVMVEGRYRGLVVSWEAPATDGGSDITGYQLDLHSAGEKHDERTVSHDDRREVFAGLLSGQPYEVRVIALNKVGMSEPVGERGVPLHRVAFVSDHEGNDAIYFVDFSTSGDVMEPVRVTDGDLEEGSPSWSPDGSWIAFHRRTPQDSHWQLYVRNIESGEELQLVCDSENGWSPNWSPDGKYLAFARGSEGNDIWTIDVETGNARSLKDKTDKDDAYPSWSPDGDTIAFARKDYLRGLRGWNPREIRILTGLAFLPERDPDVDLLTKEVRGYEDGDYTSPTWSPDGDEIAYAISTRDSEYRHIDVMGEDGTKLRQLTMGEHHDNDPSWSPDDGWIVFARGAEDSRDLYVVPSMGGEPLPLLSDDRLDYWAPSWSPNSDVEVDPTFDCRQG